MSPPPGLVRTRSLTSADPSFPFEDSIRATLMKKGIEAKVHKSARRCLVYLTPQTPRPLSHQAPKRCDGQSASYTPCSRHGYDALGIGVRLVPHTNDEANLMTVVRFIDIQVSA
jgi:hypothetical protein